MFGSEKNTTEERYSREYNFDAGVEKAITEITRLLETQRYVVVAISCSGYHRKLFQCR